MLPTAALSSSRKAPIPDGEYELVEWYCPNVACDCREVIFSVMARRLKRTVVWIRSSLDANKRETRLFAGPASDRAPYAEALLEIVAENLRNDPVYIARLKMHYDQVRRVAADATHPAHRAVMEWGRTGGKPEDNRNRRERESAETVRYFAGPMLAMGKTSHFDRPTH